jgi:hypothetical protein
LRAKAKDELISLEFLADARVIVGDDVAADSEAIASAVTLECEFVVPGQFQT